MRIAIMVICILALSVPLLAQSFDFQSLPQQDQDILRWVFEKEQVDVTRPVIFAAWWESLMSRQARGMSDQHYDAYSAAQFEKLDQEEKDKRFTEGTSPHRRP